MKTGWLPQNANTRNEQGATQTNTPTVITLLFKARNMSLGIGYLPCFAHA